MLVVAVLLGHGLAGDLLLALFELLGNGHHRVLVSLELIRDFAILTSRLSLRSLEIFGELRIATSYFRGLLSAARALDQGRRPQGYPPFR